MDNIFSKDNSKEANWPIWPKADLKTEKIIHEVLYSGRWAISGESNGKPSFNERFAQLFAEYHKVPFCVTCANGSAALVIALEGVGVKNGDEVLVPGLTWVACASAVIRIGAIPVFVDIDSDSLCMSLEMARKSITSKTSAILLVHSYCSIANITGFVSLSTEMNIPLIEDCSHAHGALFNGNRVGTYGIAGVFSFQQSKVLTCGEGGAVITADSKLANRLEQLRADGRSFYINRTKGMSELNEKANIQGYNYCLSEFQAAILIDRLEHLDLENKKRTQNGLLLNNSLKLIDGIRTIFQCSKISEPTIYRYCFVIENANNYITNPIQEVIRLFWQELKLKVFSLHSPIYKSELYIPLSCGRIRNEEFKRLDSLQYYLSVSEFLYKNTICLPHQILLNDEQDISLIIEVLVDILNKSRK